MRKSLFKKKQILKKNVPEIYDYNEKKMKHSMF